MLAVYCWRRLLFIKLTGCSCLLACLEAVPFPLGHRLPEGFLHADLTSIAAQTSGQVTCFPINGGEFFFHIIMTNVSIYCQWHQCSWSSKNQSSRRLSLLAGMMDENDFWVVASYNASAVGLGLFQCLGKGRMSEPFPIWRAAIYRKSRICQKFGEQEMHLVFLYNKVSQYFTVIFSRSFFILHYANTQYILLGSIIYSLRNSNQSILQSR